LCGFYITLNARSLNVDISTALCADFGPFGTCPRENNEKYPNITKQLKKIALKITSTINSW
jgi:hypothetical protein